MVCESYYYGNLWQVFVQVIVYLIEEKGLQVFILVEVVCQVGVSVVVFYCYFVGCDELLEEVVWYGFEEFLQWFEIVFFGGKFILFLVLFYMGKVYLVFVVEWCGYYIVMFEFGILIILNFVLIQVVDWVCGVLVMVVEELFCIVFGDQCLFVWMVVDYIWVFSYGVVELFSCGKFGGCLLILFEDMLESGMLIYLCGFGVIFV